MADSNSLQKREYDVVFCGEDVTLVFSHNDFPPSNIIVQDDKIVGVIDLGTGGLFRGRDERVHRTMREEV